MDKVSVRMRVEEWRGRVSNPSPHTLKPGAGIDHNNLRCINPGETDVRGGMTPVTFSNTTTSTTNSIIAMANYSHPLGDMIVYEDSAGNIKAGRNPS